MAVSMAWPAQSSLFLLGVGLSCVVVELCCCLVVGLCHWLLCCWVVVLNTSYVVWFGFVFDC